MKKLLSYALVLMMVLAFAVPVLATTADVSMKNLSMTVNYDDTATVGDTVTVTITVTSKSGQNTGYVVVGEEEQEFSLKNNESETYVFNVACDLAGQLDVAVTLAETNGSGKINESKDITITITVLPKPVAFASAAVTSFNPNLQDGNNNNLQFSVEVTLTDGSTYVVNHVESVKGEEKGSKTFDYGDYSVYAAWNDNNWVTACTVI